MQCSYQKDDKHNDINDGLRMKADALEADLSEKSVQMRR